MEIVERDCRWIRKISGPDRVDSLTYLKLTIIINCVMVITRKTGELVLAG